MIPLSLRHNKAVLLPPRVAELCLDAPLHWYANLPEVLARLSRLKCLRIEIHFARHAANWPYGRCDPYGDLNFLAGLSSLEDLQLHHMHNLCEGAVLRTLPALRRVVIGSETKFDLSWLRVSNIEELSVGLTQRIRNHELIKRMVNLRKLGVSNVRAKNLGMIRRLAKLELLGIGGTAKSLAGIGGAKNLRTLNMNNLRFEDYGDLRMLRKLEVVRIQSCYNMTSLRWLHAPGLKELRIFGSKTKLQKLDSIRPLKYSTRLEKFVFGGIIRDDDISTLSTAKHLRHCVLNRRYQLT